MLASAAHDGLAVTGEQRLVGEAFLVEPRERGQREAEIVGEGRVGEAEPPRGDHRDRREEGVPGEEGSRGHVPVEDRARRVPRHPVHLEATDLVALVEGLVHRGACGQQVLDPCEEPRHARARVGG